MAINLIGFDSAWADKPTAPGAICALRVAEDEPGRFEAPRLAGFADARDFILERHGARDLTCVAIDQPTIVPNDQGARPVERAVASLISRSGGGIQPAYRGKTSLFGDGAPIWGFLSSLAFSNDPEAASCAMAGGFVIEVFPALALLSLEPAFMSAPRCGPRYNPSRQTFKSTAWEAVCRGVAREARRLALPAVGAWCDSVDLERKPRKRLQDQLDAVICLLVAARWRAERGTCVVIGDVTSGYIVAPATDPVREHLASAALARDVPIR